MTTAPACVVSNDARNLQNHEYALGTGACPDMELMYCFNRLVDPARGVSVTVVGREYAVDQ